MASFAEIDLPPEVMRGLTQRDPSAQERAYRVLAPVVMGMAVRILRDSALAEEVVQDTFVEVLDRAHTIRDAFAVIGWVRKVAVNHCLMRLRSPWHARRVHTETLAESEDPGSTAPRVEGLHDLERALASLPARTRAVIWLHDVEGFTHREIGHLMGKTASYSKSQMARGYKRLLEQGVNAPPAGSDDQQDKSNGGSPLQAKVSEPVPRPDSRADKAERRRLHSTVLGAQPN